MTPVQVRPLASSRWRRYPPLTGAVIAMVLAMFVLPSALNVPLTSPSQTLEFAPVPPEDDQPPPPESGNVASLGLGSSPSTVGDVPGGEVAGAPPPLPPGTPAGVGDRPATKRCVGDPPRQTEDPLSPPCVAHFEGDNGGATHRGVTNDEVNVLLYYDGGGSYQTARGVEQSPTDRYYDLLADPASDDEPVFVRNLRAFQQYFNARYQTYGRYVRFHVYFDCGVACNTPETRRSDAAANLEHVDPFAVIAVPTIDGYQEPYQETLAQAGVLNFGSPLGRSETFFRQFPGRIWGYQPTIEQQVRQYSSYVCSHVVGRPVSVGGNDSDPDVRLHNGQPRRLGLLTADAPDKPAYRLFSDLSRQAIEDCGGTFAEDRTYPHAGYYTPSRHAGSYALPNVAAFKDAAVTTVLWPQGYENEHSKAAGSINYRPEWILGGDLLQESNINGQAQDPTVWDRHAYVTTTITRQRGLQESECYRAYREAAPQAPEDDIVIPCSFVPIYDDLRQLFTGIQVAGPRLTPPSIDAGFHAIPPHRSTSAFAPACFYEPGDYTCVKDATVQWWDAAGGPQGAGCWRMLEAGMRYAPQFWPQENVDARRRDDDPCNTYSRLAPFSGV